MNLSGNPEHREAYVLSVEPAGPRRGRSAQQARAAGELEGEPLVGVLEIHGRSQGERRRSGRTGLTAPPMRSGREERLYWHDGTDDGDRVRRVTPLA